MSQWISRIGDHVDVEVLEEAALAMAQSIVQNALDEAQISRADLARKMDCPRSFVTRILNGNHNLTIKTMANALAACGFEVRFQRVPIVWNWRTQVNAQPEEQLPACAGSTMLAAYEAAGTVVPAHA